MKISASDWAVISTHFDRLSDLPPQQRRSELASLAIEEKHRRQLEHLLERFERADSLGLDTDAPERLGLDRIDDTDARTGLPDWQGQRLGNWQVDEIIGRGGMSVIYRGHRADGRFDKDVAIKVLNRAQLGGDGSRLGEETRILARLEHPGIARLIDSGTSEAGHGYLVMELIRGEPLDAYCRSRNLSAPEIVDLMIEAANALEYAHQRQIVHCDIKPANLLVRDDGSLCIVDFGIAAVLQRQPDADRHLYCSPAYTAPERLRRAPPDTSQDVYSLGAVLNELLAECEDRDLQAICRRSCADEPADRYSSMTGLRADLTAWQEKRPVEARQGGRMYVLGRWLRRHSIAASLGLLLVVSLIAGAALSLWQAREARMEAARAVAARDFAFGIFEAADPALMHGEDPPASELLRRGAARVRSAMADQPRLLAQMLHAIGKTQLERGLIADAVDSLDAALSLDEMAQMPNLHVDVLSDRGMAAYEQGQTGAAVQYLQRARRLAVGAGRKDPALASIEVRLADMLLVDGRPAEALAIVESVLARPRAADQPATGQNSHAPVRIDAQRVQGAALQETGELAEARSVLERALERQVERDDNDILRAKIEHDLGIAHWHLGELDAAAGVFARSLQHKHAVYGEDHPQTLSTLGNLAVVNMSRGDHAGAEATWKQSLESLRRVHGGPHPDIAYTWGMMAWSLYLRDEFEQALDRVEKALAHRDRLPDDGAEDLAWLTPVRSLLLLELDQPVELEGFLGQHSFGCDDAAGMSAMQLRICLARRLLETDPPANCNAAAVPATDEAALEALPGRWRHAYQLLRHRCLRDANAPLGPSGHTPAWLSSRLPRP